MYSPQLFTAGCSFLYTKISCSRGKNKFICHHCWNYIGWHMIRNKFMIDVLRSYRCLMFVFAMPHNITTKLYLKLPLPKIKSKIVHLFLESLLNCNRLLEHCNFLVDLTPPPLPTTFFGLKWFFLNELATCTFLALYLLDLPPFF